MAKPKRVMVDLETLGTRPGCVILSIGAVVFDEEDKMLGRKFYVEINQNSCTELGLYVDPSTMEWWKKQDLEARRVLYATSGTLGRSLPDALEMFGNWLEAAFSPNWSSMAGEPSYDPSKLKDVEIWGNGSDFDNAILAAAYRATNLPQPWQFYNSRCYRTLKNLFPQHKMAKRIGTHHNALDDAESQARHAIVLLRAAAVRLTPPPTAWQKVKRWFVREFKWLP